MNIDALLGGLGFIFGYSSLGGFDEQINHPTSV